MQSPAELGVLRLKLRWASCWNVLRGLDLMLRPWLPRLFAKLNDRQRKRLCSKGITTKKVGKNGKTHVLLGLVWAQEVQHVELVRI